eukprot:CAMPEP_0201522862 /NCGR_PEP_ID=MMETSP0161_2-20130828/18591_1 /ASSEMBLY_ACC=CAM_ASM_000251 /TAXON_ID=180227 /ORGANISM="Neoparamoeba aestuarina, Strain SoJaBio B1-5/56/2" /LENGTH=899 /DNA_ID=CAMNT_0047921811 /DNA_START=39 /DNA_END=2738 /DNA_ORIENTATION=+
MAAPQNPKGHLLKTLDVNGTEYKYFSLEEMKDDRIDNLPYCIRILLECAVRNCDEFKFTSDHIETILNWSENQGKSEIPFLPARVILQDFTGVPAVVDLAAMREAMKNMGGDPAAINPLVPVDLVIDHSVQVDESGRNPAALQKNQEIEMERNNERFRFLKWGAESFDDLLIVPPGAGIVHQVNLEFLGRSVFNKDGMLYPDSVVGTDSHTPMINGLGVCGWGVGGLEAEAVMCGQEISMVLPQVVGFELQGKLPSGATSTDLVLTVTEKLRKHGCVGKFVEYFGDGLKSMSIEDRATLSNMSPEYGATMGFFPVDEATLKYLIQTGRSEDKVAYIEKYLKAQKLFRAFDGSAKTPQYSSHLTLDLGSVVPSLAGPKRPEDRVALSDLPTEFKQCLNNKVGFKGFGIPEADQSTVVEFDFNGEKIKMTHGDVVISAITSCTNTSNPSVMLAAGVLAKKAVEAGLSVKPYVKTSLSPGSGVVTRYLEESGLQPFLDKLGYSVVGYGCMTCIGNSGDIDPAIGKAIQDGDLVAAAVLSGNRNFEGRIHPLTRANYLASPPLCVAFALAGSVTKDFEKEPVGISADGKEVFLKDIWPSQEEIQEIISNVIKPAFFKDVYKNIQSGSEAWQNLKVNKSTLYEWDPKSTYVRLPPYFDGMTLDTPKSSNISGAHVLLNVGDSVTTDHISPAGNISRKSPAARYLNSNGVEAKQFNTYGARRGNHEVMARGTFANIRLVNKFIGKAAPQTVYGPEKEVMDVFDAAERHVKEGHPLIILAGSAYGSGSSRDWAAKGPFLQGVKAVIAQSYERIHRSNLIGMGIVPLQFKEGENADSLGLTGFEQFDIDLNNGELTPGQDINVTTNTGVKFIVKLRFDTLPELNYYHHGGILNYVLRRLLKQSLKSE